MTPGDLVHKVLTKYKYTGIVPPQIQAQIPRIKKETFKIILKSQMSHSIFLTPALKIFSMMKKTGISLSLSEALKYTRSAAYSAAITIIVAGAFIVNTTLLHQDLSDISVIHATGNVLIKKTDGSLLPLSKGDVVTQGTMILTEEKSIAILLIDNKTMISIGENSEFTLRTALQKKQEIVLSKGILTAAVGKLQHGSSLSVETESFVATVHGTVFSVKSSNGISTLSVLKGLIAMQPKTGGIANKDNEIMIKEKTVAGIKNDLVYNTPMAEKELKLFYNTIEEFIFVAENTEENKVIQKSLHDELIEIKSADPEASSDKTIDQSKKDDSTIKKSGSEKKSDTATEQIKQVVPLPEDKTGNNSDEPQKDVKKKKAGEAIIF